MESFKYSLYRYSYPAVKAAGGNGLQYAVEDDLHNSEHCFDRLEYKAEQVDEKAAWRLVRKCGREDLRGA